MAEDADEVGEMTEYVRPRVPALEFRDDQGAVIDYGNRWSYEGEEPPEESYSRETHLERFAPLHAVARALIDHLVATYDVSVEQGLGVAEGMRRSWEPGEVVHATRLTPHSATAAPLTIVLTALPGVLVEAGVLHSFVHPSCGCDACDETWETAAGDLEWRVLAVVGGHYREHVSPPRPPRVHLEPNGDLVEDMGQTVEYELETGDGEQAQSGASRAVDVPVQELEEAQRRLEALAAAVPDGRWQAWPRREGEG